MISNRYQTFRAELLDLLKMKVFLSVLLPYCCEILLFISFIDSSVGRRFEEESFYPNYYDQEARYGRIKTALGKLNDSPKWIENWPSPSVKLGQVSGVALDNQGLVYVFHRATNQWDATTFTDKNVYRALSDLPIAEPTIVVLNDTGDVVDQWGQDLFYMPHGITIDHEGNVWVTDVALHQVFKFKAGERSKPALTLGEKFVPRNDETHFCKPSAVAVLSNGDFFVADGYCNTRIIKFAPDGTRILQWGKASGDSPFTLSVPHALTISEDHNVVCVANRERGRVECYRTDNGTFVTGYSSWLIGGRLFSVAYSPVKGGRLYLVNGPSNGVPVRGYVIDYNSGTLIQTFAPPTGLSNPHDIVTTPDGTKTYVAELNPFKVYKFIDEKLNETKTVVKNVTLKVKPTATVEVAGGSLTSSWRLAAGGAAGAAGCGLLLLSAGALLRARNRGRKNVTRRWEYGEGQFKLRRLLDRRRFTRVHTDDSDDEPAPMLPPQPPANA